MDKKLFSRIFLYGPELEYFFETLKFFLRNPQFPDFPRFLSISIKMSFYVLNNNFSYIQLSFVFVLQKDSYFAHNDTETFFLFLLQKDF